MPFQPPRTHRNLADPITAFQVLGERNSGTNFLTQLVLANVTDIERRTKFGWKHGFVDRRTAATPGFLTLVIYRHPLRWLQSVHLRPLELSSAVKSLDFSEFLRHEWQGAFHRDDGTEDPSTADMVPHTHDRNYPNPIALRNAKIRWLEEMATMPGQIAYCRYEDVNRNPRAMLEALSQAFDLRLGPYRVIERYKGRGDRRYLPKRLPQVAPADIAFIDAELDHPQEAGIGYRLADVPWFDGLPAWDRRALRARLTGIRSRRP